MLIGYARTSTLEQQAGLEAQRRELEEAHCEEIFCEQVSAVSGDRPQLETAVRLARKGDVFIVSRLDRLARSVLDLWAIVQRLDQKGVALRILGLGIDTGTPTGRLMLNLIGGVAQFEREIMLERQRIGIAKAKAEGKYAKSGRPPIAPDQVVQIRELAGLGVPKAAIARRVGVHRASVFRVLAAPAT